MACNNIKTLEAVIMGEIVSISIGSYDFLSYKNTFGDLLLPFSMHDLHLDPVTEDGETYTRRYFLTTVFKMKKCLDALGYTIDAAKSIFEQEKKERIEYASDDTDKYMEPKFSSEQLEKEFTFEAWSLAAKHFAYILSKDTFDVKNCQHGYKELDRQYKLPHSIAEQIVLDSLPFNEDETFFGIDCFDNPYQWFHSPWGIFRVLLDAFSDEQEVVLDYTNLYEGGWCDEIPEQELLNVPKTIILTEGKTDVDVISQAMDILYPYMSKHYSFIDFGIANVQGSTNFLTHYLKAFIGAHIQNRIIALYDNDAAGLSEILALKSINIPDNIRVLHLPDIKLCESYPTIGPTADENVNINGRACSIELFLGMDVLSEKGALTPIMWTGYNEKTKSYQGVITHKREIQGKFENKILNAKKEGVHDIINWNELDTLLNYIFMAFQKPV